MSLFSNKIASVIVMW